VLAIEHCLGTVGVAELMDLWQNRLDLAAGVARNPYDLATDLFAPRWLSLTQLLLQQPVKALPDAGGLNQKNVDVALFWLVANTNAGCGVITVIYLHQKLRLPKVLPEL